MYDIYQQSALGVKKCKVNKTKARNTPRKHVKRERTHFNNRKTVV